MNENNPCVLFFALHCFSSIQTGSVGLLSHAFSIHFSFAIFSNIPSPWFLLQSYAWQTNLLLLVKQNFCRQFSWLASGSFRQAWGGWKKLLRQLQSSMAITKKMTNGKIIALEYIFQLDLMFLLTFLIQSFFTDCQSIDDYITAITSNLYRIKITMHNLNCYEINDWCND